MTQRTRRVVLPPGTPSGSGAPSSGVVLGLRPEFDLPELPDDLTAMGDRALMQLFSRLVSWQNYAAVCQTNAEVEEHAAEAALRYSEAVHAMRQPTAAKVTVTRQKALTDKDVAQARDRVESAYMTRKLHGVMFANCERAANVVSRELSRRIGGGPVQGRNASWNP